ncbi:MAG: hypothetical protein GY759_16050 [Chloroflexi bacterium]|nr:hypothetical protein [Chloroflexota bacterium]
MSKIRSILLGAVAITIAVVLQGCASPQTIGSPAENQPAPPPAGQLLEAHPCQPPGDGAREGYHYPGDDIWLPDCDNLLVREYWRVFVQDEKSAYIIPRPDAAPELQAVCTDESHALRDLTDRYQLCSAATDSSQITKINNMLPEDALRLTHFLHTQLRFHFGDDGTGITPFPIPTDIVDACSLHPQTNSAELDELCERERSRRDSGQDIGYVYSGDAAKQLVELLNELYGIQ